MDGTPLYDWTSVQLRDNGFAGPWTLSIYTALIASLPAVLVYYVAIAPDQVPITLSVPIHLIVLAFLAAWGSLKEKDSTRETRARARRAYLYFNSTYGLFYQMALALAFPIFWSLNDLGQSALLLFWLFLFPLAYGGANQYRLTFIEIPQHMFQINGYSSRKGSFGQKWQPDDPPWSKYNLAVLFGGLVSFYMLVRIMDALWWLLVQLLPTIRIGIAGWSDKGIVRLQGLQWPLELNHLDSRSLLYLIPLVYLELAGLRL